MKTTGTTIQSGSDRGQTTQDFAVGISVFLLTVGFTFGFLPTLLSPFGSPVGDDITAKSDRVAGTMISDLAVDGEPRTLNATQLQAFISNNQSEASLREYFGLRASADLNVTVIDVHDGGGRDVLQLGGSPMVAGDDYRSQTPAASTTRVVLVSGGQCDVQCLLVIRVW
ncbi:DUF7287 family protein [Haloarchaeobius baliensis]|uniref:DUF7287 family protein n=1 Tax=Haloarchaeobius baliensis TaxID=1670458 RepID=UPI003F8820B7